MAEEESGIIIRKRTKTMGCLRSFAAWPPICQIHEITEQHTKTLAAPKQNTTNVDTVRFKTKQSQQRPFKQKTYTESESSQPNVTCRNCGNKHDPDRRKCPAFCQQCHKCNKWNHFKQCCRSTQSSHKYRQGRAVNVVDTAQGSSSSDESYYVDGLSIATDVVDTEERKRGHFLHSLCQWKALGTQSRYWGEM